ncbi:MAG TPA: hypothetical protein VD969_09565 [Symbiobacteriaceae bacterium]|nr:hypothetical protein [Symbiobacteriaceae bacterium]
MMLWWIGAALVWLVSAACIVVAMVKVFRGKAPAFGKQALSLYAFHGVAALLALWLAFAAAG